jgi:hypothetical protein
MAVASETDGVSENDNNNRNTTTEQYTLSMTQSLE